MMTSSRWKVCIFEPSLIALTIFYKKSRLGPCGVRYLFFSSKIDTMLLSKLVSFWCDALESLEINAALLTLTSYRSFKRASANNWKLCTPLLLAFFSRCRSHLSWSRLLTHLQELGAKSTNATIEVQTNTVSPRSLSHNQSAQSYTQYPPRTWHIELKFRREVLGQWQNGTLGIAVGKWRNG